MIPVKPPALLHVDCDGLWAVKACYGAPSDPGEAADPFWVEGVPAAASLLAEAGALATFFMVGRDLRESETHRSLAGELLASGHEIASHGSRHRMALRSADAATLEREIDPAAVRETLGVTPLGFRAPGFSWQPALPGLLRRAGYRYDSSMFVSPWGPVLRGLRGRAGRATSTDHEPYGGFRLGAKPREPHLLEGGLVEVPVSVTPLLRLPAHASFALLRSDRSFEGLVHWHAQRRLPFVWLLHLIDLVDTEHLDLPVAPWARKALCRSGGEKRERLRRMLRIIHERFEIVRTDRWVESEFDGKGDSAD